MRYEQRTERIGERVADIDWSYDFLSHYSTMGSDDAANSACERGLAWLRQMETAHKAGAPTIEATTYGGWPRCGWGRVLDVGMYDGWPYWKPTPSVLINGWAGASWACFSSVTDIREEVSRV